MDIVERYIGAYIVECLTGISGNNPSYYSILSETRSNTKHPLLGAVLDITYHQDPRSPKIKEEVRAYCLNYLSTKYPGLIIEVG